MQVAWKVASLNQYQIMVKSENIPDFSDRCLICNAKDCATYNGSYTRSVIDPLNNIFFHYFEILQYLCHGKGSNKFTHHVTFTLLPYMLIPYHRLPLFFILYAIKVKLENKISYLDLVTKLNLDCREYYKAFDYSDIISVNALFFCKTIIDSAFNRFIGGDAFKSILTHSENQKFFEHYDDDRLLYFINFVINFKCEYNNQTFTGACDFAWLFYQLSGIEYNPPFLFGRASQQRF